MKSKTGAARLNALALAARAGDADALVELLALLRRRINFRVTRLMAPDQMGWATREDMEQVGRIAVVEAVEDFDPDRGAFGPFAMKRAVAAINDAISREMPGPAIPGRTMRRYLSAMDEAQGDEVQARDLAEMTPLTFDAVHAADLTESIQANEVVAEAATAIPALEPDDEDPEALAYRLLDALDDRARKLVTLVYLDGMTVGDAAEVIGVSRRTAHRILPAALAEMRATATQEDES